MPARLAAVPPAPPPPLCLYCGHGRLEYSTVTCFPDLALPADPLRPTPTPVMLHGAQSLDIESSWRERGREYAPAGLRGSAGAVLGGSAVDPLGQIVDFFTARVWGHWGLGNPAFPAIPRCR